MQAGKLAIDGHPRLRPSTRPEQSRVRAIAPVPNQRCRICPAEKSHQPLWKKETGIGSSRRYLYDIAQPKQLSSSVRHAYKMYGSTNYDRPLLEDQGVSGWRVIGDAVW